MITALNITIEEYIQELNSLIEPNVNVVLDTCIFYPLIVEKIIGDDNCSHNHIFGRLNSLIEDLLYLEIEENREIIKKMVDKKETYLRFTELLSEEIISRPNVFVPEAVLIELGHLENRIMKSHNSLRGSIGRAIKINGKDKKLSEEALKVKESYLDRVKILRDVLRKGKMLNATYFNDKGYDHMLRYMHDLDDSDILGISRNKELNRDYDKKLLERNKPVIGGVDREVVAASLYLAKVKRKQSMTLTNDHHIASLLNYFDGIDQFRGDMRNLFEFPPLMEVKRVKIGKANTSTYIGNINYVLSNKEFLCSYPEPKNMRN